MFNQLLILIALLVALASVAEAFWGYGFGWPYYGYGGFGYGGWGGWGGYGLGYGWGGIYGWGR